MFQINSSPAGDTIREVMNTYPNYTSTEVYQYIMDNFTESWFTTTTPSLKGSDNRLYHRVRSIFSQK